MDDYAPGGAWTAAGSEAEPETADQHRRADMLRRVFTLDELLTQESPHAEPLLGPLVRRGCRTVIGGYGGHGKTTMAMHMVRAIVEEAEFLGWRGEGGKALVIDIEQGISRAQYQVLKTFYPAGYGTGRPLREMVDEVLGGDMGAAKQIKYADWPEGLRLDDSTHVDAAVVEEVIADWKPDVVLLDPLYKAFLGNPNEHELINRVTRTIDGWRKLYGFAFILPMHPRKPPNQGGSFTMHDLAGAGTWSWWAEVVLGIKRTPHSGALLHFWKDSFSALPDPTDEPWRLVFDGSFRRASESAVPLTTADKIMQILSAHSPQWLTRVEMKEMLGVSQDTIDKTCKRLESRMAEGKLEALQIDNSHGRAKLYRVVMDPAAQTIQRVIDMFGTEEEDDYDS